MSSLKMASLFSGVGGFDLAAEHCGVTVAWQSEIDRFACKVLAHRFPGVPNLGDIRDVGIDRSADGGDAKASRRTALHVDVLTAGWP